MKKNFLNNIIFIFYALTPCAGLARPWTTTYHFTPQLFHEYPGMIVVEKKAHHHFNQLLVSWNAALPLQGYLRFYVELFDEKSNQWLRYKMYEWGDAINRSLCEKTQYPEKGRFTHVRFESDYQYRKFKIKVEAIDGAQLSVLRHISVCASNMNLFKVETVNLPQIRLNNKSAYMYLADVPAISQHDARYPESSGWCSPASLAQVIEYFSSEQIDLATLARKVFDENLAIFGSWPFNTAQAGVYLPDHLCYLTRLRSLQELIDVLCRGYPVIVSICCVTPLPGAPKAYDKGHLITVVGFDVKKNELICHDTAEKESADVVKHYPLKPFIQAWERRHRLAYITVPTGMLPT